MNTPIYGPTHAHTHVQHPVPVYTACMGDGQAIYQHRDKAVLECAHIGLIAFYGTQITPHTKPLIFYHSPQAASHHSAPPVGPLHITHTTPHHSTPSSCFTNHTPIKLYVITSLWTHTNWPWLFVHAITQRGS